MDLPVFKRITTVTVIVVLFAYPILYLGNYAGDAQVHLIYGENASHGRFFEFNKGENSPGVTSPGFMLLLAGMFKIAPDTIVPALMKSVNLLTWYLLVTIFFLIARRLIDSTIWALLATLIVGLMPGSVYNSTIGMENGIFGLLIIGWFYYAMRTEWFSSIQVSNTMLIRELSSGGLLGIACLLRPEGFLIAGLAVCFRAIIWLRGKTQYREILLQSVTSSIPIAVLAASSVYFHYYYTGYWIPESGTSRILMSNVAHDTFSIGPVFASPKFTVRMLAYFPITFLLIIGTWLVTTQKDFFTQSKSVIAFSIVLFGIFYVLYSTVLGSTHLARYIIFAMPMAILIAVTSSKWLWEQTRFAHSKALLLQRTALVASLIVLIAVYGLETNIRMGLDSQSSLARSMSAVNTRTEFTDELLARVGGADASSATIALQEVQLKYWLDDRILVRSLDGRVDPVLLEYANTATVNHIGYLKEREVDYLLELPNYNGDRTAWSLGELTKLAPGESLEKDEIMFTRISAANKGLASTNLDDTNECTGNPPSGRAPHLEWFMSAIICITHKR